MSSEPRAALQPQDEQLLQAHGIRRALLISQGFAILWWLAALYIRSLNIAPVWFDQETTFMVVARHVSAPYEAIGRFINPPWTAALLLPFGALSLEWSTLIQTCLYFAILTGVIFKFKGTLRSTLVALSSFMALIAVIELNIDWLVCIGLLVPASFSSIFLLIKPQLALGYYFSFKHQQIVQALPLLIGMVMLSLLIWGWWLPKAIANNASVSDARTGFNLAPMAVLTPFVSLPLGGLLAWQAWRKHDAVIGILAWLFFAPYLTYYSLLPVFAVCSARWWKITLLISVVMWIVYGGVLVLALLR